VSVRNAENGFAVFNAFQRVDDVDVGDGEVVGPS
jgi:hypothetical protein